MCPIVNVHYDPELREKLLSDELFKYKCPECGKDLRVPYDFLYHDMDHRFVILFSFYKEDNFKYESIDISEFVDYYKDYTHRQVNGLMELKEKILILEKGLNDVAIERMKYAICHYEYPIFAERGVKLSFVDVRYDISDYPKGAILFKINAEGFESKSYAFPLNFYYHQCLACEIYPRMKLSGSETVDEGWMAIKLGSKSDEEKRLLEKPIEENKGFFIIRKQIRKSKNNPKTRYLEGIAYKNGDILFPMMFEHIRWFGEKEAALAELGDKTYILDIRGGIFDPEKYKAEQEKVIEN
jgi:hypothetical protein